MSIVEDAAGPPDPGLIRWIGYGLTALGAAAAVYAWLTPGPWTAALALLLAPAPLALALAWPQAFEVAARGRQSFNPIIGGGALALLVMAFNANLLDYMRPWESAAGGAVVFGAAAMLVAQRPGLARPFEYAIVMAVLGAVLGYAGFVIANQRFDPTPRGSPYQASIASMYTGHSRSGTSYHLDLTPWGPQGLKTSVEVSHTFYQGHQVGDQVCLALYPGLLGDPWYTVGGCDGPVPDSGA